MIRLQINIFHSSCSCFLLGYLQSYPYCIMYSLRCGLFFGTSMESKGIFGSVLYGIWWCAGCCCFHLRTLVLMSRLMDGRVRSLYVLFSCLVYSLCVRLVGSCLVSDICLLFPWYARVFPGLVVQWALLVGGISITVDAQECGVWYQCALTCRSSSRLARWRVARG